MNMDHNYARQKLQVLIRDLSHYTGDEFWREMSRIAGGATGADHAEELQAKLAAIGRLSPTDYDDREQLLGALFRILRGQAEEAAE